MFITLKKKQKQILKHVYTKEVKNSIIKPTTNKILMLSKESTSVGIHSIKTVSLVVIAFVIWKTLDFYHE
jgi:hypothetical protein